MAISSVLGPLFRSLFIIVLIVETLRVSSPQNETILSSYETPGDLVRILMGLGLCVWLVVNLFRLPKDSGVFRTWMFMGPAVIPLAVLCAVVTW